MKTTITHTNKRERELRIKTAIIEHGKSRIVIKKYTHAVDSVTVTHSLTSYLMGKYEGDYQNALQTILEGLTAKDLRRLLFDELDAQSVQPTTLKFKTLVYKVYTKKKKGN